MHECTNARMHEYGNAPTSNAARVMDQDDDDDDNDDSDDRD
jgi:hypothetical protein